MRWLERMAELCKFILVNDEKKKRETQRRQYNTDFGYRSRFSAASETNTDQTNYPAAFSLPKVEAVGALRSHLHEKKYTFFAIMAV